MLTKASASGLAFATALEREVSVLLSWIEGAAETGSTVRFIIRGETHCS